MSNTKSPKTRSYRICRTDNKNHLNGVITLVEFEDKTGIASVYVSETREGHDKPVWHVSSELIEHSEKYDCWFTPKPHVRYNKKEQIWCFTVICEREQGLPPTLNNGGVDNGKNYINYIKYGFFKPNEDYLELMLQGEGTGTGGNGETGE